MREVFRRTVYVMASQVGLYDVEEGPYPSDWTSDDELAIFGPRGVAVSAPGDEEIEVAVFEGDGNLNGDLILSTEIQVGARGLYVGTVFMFEELPWPAGKTAVQVYTEGPRGRPTRVAFVLNPLLDTDE
jgi:hypothetical protein